MQRKHRSAAKAHDQRPTRALRALGSGASVVEPLTNDDAMRALIVSAANAIAEAPPAAPAPPVPHGAGQRAGGSPADSRNPRWQNELGQFVRKAPPGTPVSALEAAAKAAIDSGSGSRPTGVTIRALGTPEARTAFCEAIIEHNGVVPACKALGLHTSTVFWMRGKDTEFGEQLNAAWSGCVESGVAGLHEEANSIVAIADEAANAAVASGNPEMARAVIDGAKIRILARKHKEEILMRMVGKLMPALYGERPSTEIHNGDKIVGLVVDADTQKRLIQLREKILFAPGGPRPRAPAHTASGPSPEATDVTDTNGKLTVDGRLITISQG